MGLLLFRYMFTPNITKGGRIVRALWAVALFIGAAFAFRAAKWAGILLALAGLFALFEALRGWCALRACGIKTKL